MLSLVHSETIDFVAKVKKHYALQKFHKKTEIYTKREFIVMSRTNKNVIMKLYINTLVQHCEYTCKLHVLNAYPY